MRFFKKFLVGDGLSAKAARGAIWAAMGHGGSQFVRLASNLILTRLLFPEAFGIMALVTIFMIGLSMFSDLGIGPAIQRSPAAEDPDFLDTAWTIQVFRGGILWLATCALAMPVAAIYEQPSLAVYLPIAGLSLLISGLAPTRIETAVRQLVLGRVTIIELVSQIVGVVVMIVFAWATKSVWSLVVGGVISALARVVLANIFLDGHVNRLRWHRAYGWELIHFGKWIFLSTACSFAITQGDRAILGAYLTLGMLGVYNISYFLASAPYYLAGAVVWKILIPIYREKPPFESEDNRRKLSRMRMSITSVIMCALLFLACSGVPLVELLYDPRYELAGTILVLAACAQIPQIISLSYDQVALAAGDSRGYFLLVAIKAVIQTLFFLIGVNIAGVFGALLGQGLAHIMTYPAVIWIARRHGAWDAKHDGVFAILGVSGAVLAIWLNFEDILKLAESSF